MHYCRGSASEFLKISGYGSSRAEIPASEREQLTHSVTLSILERREKATFKA